MHDPSPNKSFAKGTLKMRAVSGGGSASFKENGRFSDGSEQRINPPFGVGGEGMEPVSGKFRTADKSAVRVAAVPSVIPEANGGFIR